MNSVITFRTTSFLRPLISHEAEEVGVMFREVLTRLPDLELANDEPLPYRPSNFICGLEAMPVRFTPGGAP
jgi:hypothetical protein